MTAEQTICVVGRVAQKTANFRVKDLFRATPRWGAAWCILCKALRSASVRVRQVRAFPFGSLQPKGNMQQLVVCNCQFCNSPIEFDAELLQPNQHAQCPHCNLETVLFVPYQAPSPEPTPPKAIKVRMPILTAFRWKAIGVAGAFISFGILGALGDADSQSGGGAIGGFFMGMLSLLVLVVVVGIYFLPSIMAYQNKKKNRQAISILNFFLGWTIIGWVVALVWAHVKD